MLAHLLDLGMDINGMSDFGWPAGRGHGLFTPLHSAVMADSPEVISFLLKRGANREIRSSTGETPLERAIRTERKAATINALEQE
jgi:ankyrin repeat protein